MSIPPLTRYVQTSDSGILFGEWGSLRMPRPSRGSRAVSASRFGRDEVTIALSAGPSTFTLGTGRLKKKRAGNFPALLIAVQTTWLLGFIRQQRLVCSGRSLRPHVPNSESAEAQLLLKQLAGIVAQNPRGLITPCEVLSLVAPPGVGVAR
jgi:hypothetical protein